MNIYISEKYALILQGFCNENMERASGFFEKKSMKISRQGIMSSKSNNQTTANGYKNHEVAKMKFYVCSG